MTDRDREIESLRKHREIDRGGDRQGGEMEEEGREFLSNVSLGFRALCEANQWRKISAAKSKEDITYEIQYEIKKLFKNK